MATSAPDSFATKVELVLKLLAMSRGRLAADLGVDKSVVSRWLGGQTVPSGENRSRLTRLVATRCPGFTGLDWDRDIGALTALFAGGAPPDDATVASPFFAAMFPSARSARCAAIDGHWFAWRMPFQGGDCLMRDLVRIRSPDESVIWISGPLRGEGPLVIGDGRVCIVTRTDFSELPALIWLYTQPGKRMQLMDGLYAGVIGRTPRPIAAGLYVLERHADILPEREADDAFLDSLAAQDSMIDASHVAPEIVARLRAARNDPAILLVSPEAPLARLSTRADEQAAAAASAAFLASRGG